MICIAGSIPLRSIERGLGVHHTMGDRTWDRFLGAFAQVTAAQARLTPYNAVAEIDRLILTAWREKLAVYMELPSDIAHLDIEVPEAPLVLAQPPSDPERLRSCTAAIAARLSDATSPAILVDQDAGRYGVAAEIMELAAKMQMPVALRRLCRASQPRRGGPNQLRPSHQRRATAGRHRKGASSSSSPSSSLLSTSSSEMFPQPFDLGLARLRDRPAWSRWST